MLLNHWNLKLVYTYLDDIWTEVKGFYFICSEGVSYFV